MDGVIIQDFKIWRIKVSHHSEKDEMRLHIFVYVYTLRLRKLRKYRKLKWYNG